MWDVSGCIRYGDILYGTLVSFGGVEGIITSHSRYRCSCLGIGVMQPDYGSAGV